MANNNKNSTLELTGSIKLTDLAYAQVQGQPGQQWLMIPIEANPALFLTHDKKTGKPSVSLDITIWRNEAPKYDNTHYIRASVGKKNSEGLTDDQRRDASMILGNARVYTQKPAPQPGAAPAAPAAPGYGGNYPPQGPYTPQGMPAQGAYAPQAPYQPTPGPQAPYYPQQQGGYARPPQPEDLP